MQGDEGYKIVGNMAIEAKSNSARIGLLNVLVSQFNTGRTTCKKETIYHYDRKHWFEKGSNQRLTENSTDIFFYCNWAKKLSACIKME